MPTEWSKRIYKLEPILGSVLRPWAYSEAVCRNWPRDEARSKRAPLLHPDNCAFSLPPEASGPLRWGSFRLAGEGCDVNDAARQAGMLRGKSHQVALQ